MLTFHRFETISAEQLRLMAAVYKLKLQLVEESRSPAVQRGEQQKQRQWSCADPKGPASTSSRTETAELCRTGGEMVRPKSNIVPLFDGTNVSNLAANVDLLGQI